MAPYVGPSPRQVLRRLNDHPDRRDFKLTLGRYAPEAVVLQQRGRWTLCALVENERILREVEERDQREGYYMPEHAWTSLEPGPPLIVSDAKEEFLSRIEPLLARYCPADDQPHWEPDSFPLPPPSSLWQRLRRWLSQRMGIVRR